MFILDELGFRGQLSLEPIWIISIINGVIALSGFVFLQLIKKFVKKQNHLAIWTAYLTLMMIVGILIFAYVPMMYVALFGFIFFTVVREGAEPLLNAILITHVPSRIKATVLSGFGQLDAIGQLLSGVIMVSASVIFGIQNMYLITAMLLVVPVISLFGIVKIELQQTVINENLS